MGSERSGRVTLQVEQLRGVGAVMIRRFPALQDSTPETQIPDGIYLVRVERANFMRRASKTFYQLRLRILEPAEFVDRAFVARLYCTTKALWRLLWFLQAFGYDRDLLHRNEVDERALVGLRGVVQVSRVTVGDRSFIDLDGFELEHRWRSISRG
jgi:hypothetical protein